jgi:hypothetical protein
MNWRNTWCHTAVLATLVVFTAGCGEEISTDAIKLSDLEPKPKEEPKQEVDPAFTAGAGADAATEQPTDDGFGAPPEQPDAGQGGDGATGPSASTTGPPANTYGHGAPILLKSDVSQADVMVANGRIGRKGQGYGGGIITEPLSQYFQIQTRIEFLNMKSWLKNFWALNNNKSPPTVEEFDKKILKEAGVSLPELSPGQFYVYDPSAKDLDLVLTVGLNKPQ